MVYPSENTNALFFLYDFLNHFCSNQSPSLSLVITCHAPRFLRVRSPNEPKRLITLRRPLYKYHHLWSCSQQFNTGSTIKVSNTYFLHSTPLVTKTYYQNGSFIFFHCHVDLCSPNSVHGHDQCSAFNKLLLQVLP